MSHGLCQRFYHECHLQGFGKEFEKTRLFSTSVKLLDRVGLLRRFLADRAGVKLLLKSLGVYTAVIIQNVCIPLRHHGRREYICKHCHRQSSVTIGTVLHRTHLLLTVWFWAIYLVARDKRGISAVQLSRDLEVSYSRAWYLLHRLRRDMGQRDQDYVRSGIVESDNTYFGTPKSNGKRGRGTEKTSALVAVSLTKQGHPRFLKIQVSKLDAESVSAVAQQTICPDSEISSDALGSFRAALREGYDNHFQLFDQDNGALRWVHTLISNVKSSLLETFHGLGKKHLQTYFDEFAFRFNRRFWPEQLFPRLVRAVAASYILGYDDLTL